MGARRLRALGEFSWSKVPTHNLAHGLARDLARDHVAVAVWRWVSHNLSRDLAG